MWLNCTQLYSVMYIYQLIKLMFLEIIKSGRIHIICLKTPWDPLYTMIRHVQQVPAIDTVSVNTLVVWYVLVYCRHGWLRQKQIHCVKLCWHDKLGNSLWITCFFFRQVINEWMNTPIFKWLTFIDKIAKTDCESVTL